MVADWRTVERPPIGQVYFHGSDGRPCACQRCVEDAMNILTAIPVQLQGRIKTRRDARREWQRISDEAQERWLTEQEAAG